MSIPRTPANLMYESQQRLTLPVLKGEREGAVLPVRMPGDAGPLHQPMRFEGGLYVLGDVAGWFVQTGRGRCVSRVDEGTGRVRRGSRAGHLHHRLGALCSRLRRRRPQRRRAASGRRGSRASLRPPGGRLPDLAGVRAAGWGHPSPTGTRLVRVDRPGTRITGRSWSRSRPIKPALRVDLGPARPTLRELLLERRVDRVGIKPVLSGDGAAQDPGVPMLYVREAPY